MYREKRGQQNAHTRSTMAKEVTGEVRQCLQSRGTNAVLSVQIFAHCPAP
jgi:hypothetical protein